MDNRYEPAVGGYGVYVDYEAFTVTLDPGYRRITDICIKGKGVETYCGLKIDDNLDTVKELFIDRKCTLEHIQGIQVFSIYLPFLEGSHPSEDIIA